MSLSIGFKEKKATVSAEKIQRFEMVTRQELTEDYEIIITTSLRINLVDEDTLEILKNLQPSKGSTEKSADSSKWNYCIASAQLSTKDCDGVAMSGSSTVNLKHDVLQDLIQWVEQELQKRRNAPKLKMELTPSSVASNNRRPKKG
jgi:hypothetical protein